MKLSRSQILAALRAMSERLTEQGVQGEICLFGGTAMMLAFDAREMTRDVDAVFRPAAILRDAARSVAREQGLPEDWLNDGVKGYVSEREEVTTDHLPELPNLRLTRPTERYLLAMKCLAARVPGYDSDGDRADVLFLAKRLGLRTADEVLDVVSAYYPKDRILVKTQFFVEELFEEGRK